MALPQVVFDSKEIQLKRLFDNTEKMGYKNPGLPCKKVEDVYGTLNFGEIPENRPITYASYVMSIDGKIAFEDNEVGPLIAKNNYLDSAGAFADFWVLNMLRGNCDGIIIGSGTLIKEPSYSGSAYDPDIIEARVKAGKPIAPWTVIVTSTGKNIPFENPVFQCEEVPVLISTSPKGFENLKMEIKKDYFLVPMVESEEDKEKIKKMINDNKGKIAISITGCDKETNPEDMFKVLRAMGMERVLVESPTYCHYLMQKGLLDEAFINTSSVFVGGKATSIGSQNNSFSSIDHPHSEIVSIHIHNSYFLYTRYKLMYGVKPNR